jgi:hypothetical protein
MIYNYMPVTCTINEKYMQPNKTTYTYMHLHLTRLCEREKRSRWVQNLVTEGKADSDGYVRITAMMC